MSKLPPDALERLSQRNIHRDKVDFNELPVWVRNVAAMNVLLGVPFQKGCKKYNRSTKTLKEYKSSVAYKAWEEELKAKAVDPEFIAQSLLKSSTLNVTLEYLAAYEKAISSGDYKEVAKMSQDLLDRGGITKKKEVNDQRVVVKLDLGGMSLEAPTIEASYEEVEEDEDYVMVSVEEYEDE